MHLSSLTGVVPLRSYLTLTVGLSIGLSPLPLFFFLKEVLHVPLHSFAVICICGCVCWVCSPHYSATSCGRVKDIASFPSL